MQEVAINDMQIGAADRASLHLQTEFVRSWLRIRSLDWDERRSRSLKHHRLHDMPRHTVKHKQQADRSSACYAVMYSPASADCNPIFDGAHSGR